MFLKDLGLLLFAGEQLAKALSLSKPVNGGKRRGKSIITGLESLKKSQPARPANAEPARRKLEPQGNRQLNQPWLVTEVWVRD